jgi:signal peptidase II
MPEEPAAAEPTELAPALEAARVPPPPEAPGAALLAARVGPRPTFVFFGAVAAGALFADVATKAWAEVVLSKRSMLDPAVVLVKNHLTLALAYNKGGAWGLATDWPEAARKPFFLAVSVLAVAFIVSLYGRLAPTQRALKWGLPLVLGGALGNFADRITRSSVIDFIDYRADWVESMNRGIAAIHGWLKPLLKLEGRWSITDHWPTFNVADVAICIGVGLMAVDMVTSRRKPREASKPAGA